VADVPTTGPDELAIDLSEPRSVHVVGIGGAGMSAIASVLATMGHQVSGSDLKESAGLNALRGQGIDVQVPHDAANVGAVDAVAVSTAIPERNPERRAAVERGIPVLSRAAILRAIASTRRTVAVSGTHGKTTTSSMLSLVLVEAGMRPSFIVGGELNEIGTGAVWDDGEWFVVEADESDGTFLELGAEVAVVTNVEADHLDFYGDLSGVEAAFDRFLAEAPGPNLVCADDPGARRLGALHGAVTYGTAEDADYRIVDPVVGRVGSTFGLVHDGERLGDVRLPIPGLHNIRNATAALVAGMLVGAPFGAGRDAMARYAGVVRRYQFRGEVDGITVVDDYAHNPGKVAAAVSTAGAGGWDRVVVVFQPHRYSRTEDLWQDFHSSFAGADLTVVTDVYPAGEAPRPGVTGHLVVDAIRSAHPDQAVEWVQQRGDVVPFLVERLRAGDLCMTLGAGDITSLPDELLDALARRPGLPA
jgi:UDP-N-acetylmuramate--alanine ligase